MREHSGAEGKNNTRNPTLKDTEAAKGRSGEAELEGTAGERTPSRKSTTKPG